MSFDRIWGQEFAVGTLKRALRSGRLHHAYRFEGPEGVGKEMAAMALAQSLVCEQPRDSEGCGGCEGCRRAVTFSQEEPFVPLHPDVLVLERGLYNGIGIEERQDLSVKQIRRALLDRLLVPPHGGQGRMVLIRRAEEMNLQAANAILKTLEEPPPRTHFVLLTSKPRMILDTIRSRSIPLRFVPLRSEVLRKILDRHQVTPQVQEQILEISGGSAAAALAFASAEETEARQKFVACVRRAIRAPNAAEALALAQAQEKEKDLLRDRLTMLAVTFARETREQELSGHPALKEQEWTWCALAALQDLERNVAPTLILESMLLRMRAVGVSYSTRSQAALR
ncbi:MAG: DNA polymerase III subunit [Myxococcales bacterium]|nr:DNA polymerase III subunit [Polyangiaceae bacterium]MDW8252153.1 DNA polymerase III subunit [Myxococcales bacterium]